MCRVVQLITDEWAAWKTEPRVAELCRRRRSTRSLHALDFFIVDRLHFVDGAWYSRFSVVSTWSGVEFV